MGDFIQQIFAYLSELGYLGILIGLMIEVIPSEIVLSYGGYLIHIGEIQFLGAFIAGIIGGTFAQLFLYWLGLFGGRPFLDRYGKYLLIHSKHLTMAENWFEKYGTPVVFFARFIPVVRHAISIPAGISKMSFTQFTLLTIGAMIPWTILFLFLGMELGEHWREIDTYSKQYLFPIICFALFSLAVYGLWKYVKK